MHDRMPTLPRVETLREHVIASLQRYWRVNADAVRTLPVQTAHTTDINLPLRLGEVPLPDWGEDCGVQGKLLVPCEACVAAPGDWKNTDWWLAAFLLLEGWHERLFEAQNKPVHSYSVKLRDWDSRAWDRAWVNRIALFLRRWAAKERSRPEEELFGPLPEPEILLTHDVDAVRKTGAIRIKQTLFQLFNALRFLINGNPSNARDRLAKAASFLFRNGRWQLFEKLFEQESEASLKACFNIYADERPKNFTRLLFDPGYKLSDTQIERLLHTVDKEGMLLGLHPSYDSWNDGEKIRVQKQVLENKTGRKIGICRQHWLRFSWETTWSSQEEAGLELDTTLMFNDRSGFRNSAALQWRPFHPDKGCAHTLEALPSIFMDSHFYDYRPVSDTERRNAIDEWIEEVRLVGGQAALLWHPHTLSDDYGWRIGLQDVIQALREANND